MTTTHTRASDWLKQAKNDYQWAQKGLQEGFYSQVCFMAQQAGEKAIKAMAYHNCYEVRGHSITKVAQSMNINGDLEEAGKFLDTFYISARYPDALPAGAPFEFFTHSQAQQALDKALLIIQKATLELEYEK